MLRKNPAIMRMIPRMINACSFEEVLTVTGRAGKRAGSSGLPEVWTAAGPPASPQRLEGEQSVEESAVTAERDPHILRGRLIVFPLPFE
jgi:hypothetical protein